ncbi:Cold shock protein CspA [compost metagenome]
MFIESKTWGGYSAGEMAEVYARIGPSLGKSPVAPPREKKPKASRKQGRIKFINADKGFGFISIYGAEDVHFSQSDANGQKFMRGDRVTFEIGEDKRGRTYAKNVRLSQ